MVLYAATDRFTGLRLNFKTYLLLLCGFYLTLVFFLHIKLNHDSGSAGGRIYYDKATYENQRVLRGGLVQDIQEQHDDDDKVHITDSKPLQEETRLRDKIVIKNTGSPLIQGTAKNTSSHFCVGERAQYIADTFQEAVPDFFVYSAYWDDRPNDFEKATKSKVRVRIIAMTRSKRRPVVQCLFQGPSGYISSPLTYYEMCENHARPFGGYIVSCPVPEQIQGPVCSVAVSGQGDPGPNPVRVHVTPVNIPEEHKRQFSICVPPLFGNVARTKLVEFIELSQLMGAEHITFYNYNADADLLRTLEYFERKGIVSVIPWNLPKKASGFAIWYNGQLITIQDCMYRNMAFSNYVAFNDIDEFITPRKDTYWSEMIDHIAGPLNCGYQFKMVFFDPTKAGEYSGKKDHSKLQTAKFTQRTASISRVRTKCLVDPTKIFEKGIHHISKPLMSKYKVVQVDPNVALLHHYRKCLPDFGMRCTNFREDKTLIKFSVTLYDKFKESCDMLGGCS